MGRITTPWLAACQEFFGFFSFLALRHMINQKRWGSGPRNYKDANNVKLRASLISMSAPQLASEMLPSQRCR